MRFQRAVFAASSLSGAVVATFTTADAQLFDWQSIEPTRELQYSECYEGFLCARLRVPMDWNDPENNKTVDIAIATLPAKVPKNHPDYGGTVITNPGGPGGPGVTFVRRFGKHLQRVLDGNKKYDILSFDPRGVQYTTPRADCFGDTFARDAWGLESRGLGSLDSSDNALKRHLALFKAFGSLCEDTLRDSEILRHVSTAAVSRDMVEIVDRLDELKKKELSSLTYAENQNQDPLVHHEGKPSEVARLQYIGFSYGTVLGNTFASMFPGRVGRVVIDGVEDILDYMSGHWVTNLVDTEAIVDYFYDACFEAADRCSIREAGDTSSADIKKRIDKLIADIDESPVSFVQGKYIRAVTGNDIRSAFFTSVYKPIGLFPRLARLLSDALNGNYTLLMESVEIPHIQDSCASDNITLPLPAYDGLFAIACDDAADAPERSFEYYQDIIKQLKSDSGMVGARWAEIPIQCLGIQGRAKWRFKGPWATPPADPTLKDGIPAAPLLLLTTRLDPVTPLVNAHRMSAGHPGSAVVIQESVGHCAVPSGWSECTNQILRDYFEHGVVPKNGTICTSSCKPWQEKECGLELESTGMAGQGDGHSWDDYSWFNRRFPLGI